MAEIMVEKETEDSRASLGLQATGLARVYTAGDVCPKCACPFWDWGRETTCEGFSAWKDTDGRWYSGPARSQETIKCTSCGWGQRFTKERGKLASLTSDPI